MRMSKAEKPRLTICFAKKETVATAKMLGIVWGAAAKAKGAKRAAPYVDFSTYFVVRLVARVS
jgi:hypothetical protein